LPSGSSIDRTDAVVREASKLALDTEGVVHAVGFPGLNPLHFTNSPNTGALFLWLKAIEGRKHSAEQIAGEVNAQFSRIRNGFVFAFLPPAILGLGAGSGYSLYVEDRAGRGDSELAGAIGALQGAVAKTPGMLPPFTSYQPNVPQLELEIARTKAKEHGIALTDLFDTLQVYLGSFYVNDFSRFGRQ
jgi:multidrug efflux pump